MNSKEKKNILNNLSEKEFRQDLIIPLLSKMGYIAPIEYHGINEKGKDIVCFEYDKLNEQRFLAIVAKTGDLTGNASTNTGLITIVNQVQQAFDNAYEDLFNMKQVFINEVWVMTNGKIVSGAQESVINTLRKSNLDKQIRIIGDDRIIQLIDKHFSTYWNSSLETKESVIIQRDRLLSFIENLLLTNNVERSTIESVKSSILYSTYNPRISQNIEGLHIARVSPYSVELAKIDAEFDDYIVSNVYGITSQFFQEAKKNLQYSFYDVDETIRNADKISELTNPLEFLTQAESKLEDEYPFHGSYSSGSEFMENLRDLKDGLYELERFKAFLKHNGKLEWAKELSLSITKLLPEIEKILENNKEDELVLNFAIKYNKNVIIEYDNNNKDICFSLRYKRIEVGGYSRNKDGSLKPAKILNYALFEFRNYIEKLLDYDYEKWIEEFENESKK